MDQAFSVEKLNKQTKKILKSKENSLTNKQTNKQKQFKKGRKTAKN